MKNIQVSERIAKVIARGSKFSRRDAEKLIADGRVKIDNQIILQPNVNVTSSNNIKLDNKSIHFKPELELYKYYKPRGILVTHPTFVRSVVGQQISVIAADSIWNRLSDLVGKMTPENICKFSPDDLATSGITRPKSQYIHGIATNSVDFLSAKWDDLSDADINKHLTKFRGIGPWTSEMIMIFALLRPDIFSIGDIGLIKGVQMLVPEAVTKENVLDVSKRWAPYRTAASWYLWRMLDPVPVEY